MRAVATPVLLLGFAQALGAQGAPSTDVWLVSMREEGARVTFGTPRNATRRTGYDNQPSFTPAGDAVLYTVIGADAQADTWRFAMPDGARVRITATAESEYSPTVTPDGHTFSVIRVERDSTQRLWRFPLDGGAAPAVILPDVKPVGYHAWADDHTLVLYVLGQPATLQVADVATGAATVVARDIGRALARVPGRAAVTFLQFVRDSMSGSAGSARGAASGSTVLRWTGSTWEAVAQFSGGGVRNISRLAVGPRGDWLAFVAEDTPER